VNIMCLMYFSVDYYYVCELCVSDVLVCGMLVCELCVPVVFVIRGYAMKCECLMYLSLES
jgi:hypothetical protein